MNPARFPSYPGALKPVSSCEEPSAVMRELADYLGGDEDRAGRQGGRRRLAGQGGGKVSTGQVLPRIPLTAPNPMVITATLAGSTRTATVSVPGGPGPSTIDLPAPGCWTLHLRWSGHTDELKLHYVA